ncbi:hypothetical protein Bca4012_027645 [Brassica carinata]
MVKHIASSSFSTMMATGDLNTNKNSKTTSNQSYIIPSCQQIRDLPSSLIPSINTTIKSTQILISNVELNHHLTVRERRQLCNEWQDSKSGYSWRKGVEERLIEKLKKRYASWTQELNLITLAESNQQWWVIRVSRVCGHETAQVLGRALSHQFPEMEFTVI